MRKGDSIRKPMNCSVVASDSGFYDFHFVGLSDKFAGLSLYRSLGGHPIRRAC